MRTILLVSLVTMAAMVWAAEETTTTEVVGDSLVLVKSEPGNLCFEKIVPGTVELRSTFMAGLPETVVYENEKDYVVDYDAGTVARTADSRIPDFSTNCLYGQKDFDHNQFPGFGNTSFTVFVDYKTQAGFPLFEETNQAALLSQTAQKLQEGGPFKIIAYGDSITAGGDATSVELRFQQRYAQYLSGQFPKAVIEVENGATGGDSTRQGLQRFEEKVLTRSPDLVLLGFGMNDHNVGGVPLDEFENNLVSMVEQIHSITGAEVIMFSAFPPNPDWKFGTHRMNLYAAATEQAAKRAQCAFANVYPVWMKVLERKDCSSLLGNNINHPNDFGHWLYFQTIKSIRFQDR